LGGEWCGFGLRCPHTYSNTGKTTGAAELAVSAPDGAAPEALDSKLSACKIDDDEWDAMGL